MNVAALCAMPGLLRLPNAWDAASARRVLAAGAPFVATTSAGIAWSLGLPDGQRLGPEDLLRRVMEIRRACPQAALSVDIERGYAASADAVADLVDRLVAAGVSGLNLEDGPEAPARLAGKIAAIRARHPREALFVHARTDVYLAALAPPSRRVEETLARAARYRDAGADGLFVPGLAAPVDIRAIVAEAGLPLGLMAVPGLPRPADLEALGVRRLSTGPALPLVAYAAAERAARDVMTSDRLEALHPAGLDFASMDAAPPSP